MRHGNTWTIVRKEFARFFGDRQLLFTTVIMPGLLIYIIYSLIGSGVSTMVSKGADEVVTMYVENMPAALAPAIGAADSALVVIERPFGDEDIAQLDDKEVNVVLLRFPADFERCLAAGPGTDGAVPNVELYYNSTNNASMRVHMTVQALLDGYARPFTFNVPQVEGQRFDQATDESIGAMVWSKLLPMLIMMMLFSGVMAIAPSSIAGEKERGTIATLLVTPMRRNELALGKVVSLSCIALLSGVSSFVGIALSLPKMTGGAEAGLSFNYAPSDYVVLLLVIFSSVLIMASAVSLLSALAKDVKNAGTMVTPLMLVVMLAGLLPMFQNGAAQSLVPYFVPFYNSIEVMTAVFAHEATPVPVVVTLAANVGYTGLAVWALTRMFNSERIMFTR